MHCTLIYIQLDRTLFAEADDKFTCRVAKTEKEVSELVEAGFEYVCGLNGAKVFRKRK